MILRTILLAVFVLLNLKTSAQCVVPDGGFDEWSTYDNEIHVYDIPKYWNESVVNVFSRLAYGYGFFNKYTESDANELALLAVRRYSNRNNGYIRFECNNVPLKLKGRYKFSGSNVASETDTLIIAVHFASLPDTLTKIELNQAKLPDLNTRLFKTTIPQVNFTDFEIDFSTISSENDFNYVSIHLMIQAGIYINSSIATAVFDDFEFVYDKNEDEEETITGMEDNYTKSMLIYPNPANDILKVQCSNKSLVTSYSIVDLTGKVLGEEKHISKNFLTIEIEDLPTGQYFLKLTTDNKVNQISRFIKSNYAVDVMP